MQSCRYLQRNVFVVGLSSSNLLRFCKKSYSTGARSEAQQVPVVSVRETTSKTLRVYSERKQANIGYRQHLERLKLSLKYTLYKIIATTMIKKRFETIQITKWTGRAPQVFVGDQESLYCVYHARGSNNRVPRRRDERQYLEITNRKHHSLAVQDLSEASRKKTASLVTFPIFYTSWSLNILMKNDSLLSLMPFYICPGFFMRVSLEERIGNQWLGVHDV